ncbi:MAG: hypothetical protein EKE20_16225 [Candidatus Symbiopectobacterium sp. Dall1.0]|nr:hypothetical protein [Candidatus Symbiopectobacterium sp. Dall1.0]
MTEQNRIPEKIVENLRPYKQFKPVTCLKCGYSGHMGVKENIVPWYVSWWFITIALMASTPFAILFTFGTRDLWSNFCDSAYIAM